MKATDDPSTWITPKRGRGRPRLYSERVAFLAKVPPELVERLDRTKERGGFKSRNEAIVALLDKGAVE